MRRPIVLLTLLICACGGGDAARTTEVGRARSGDVDVVLLAGQPALALGKSTFTIEFRSATDPAQLVDVGAVSGNATMPMAGMAPMMGGLTVARTDTPGRYDASGDLGMAGQWRVELEWNGAAGPGRVTLSPMVQ